MASKRSNTTDTEKTEPKKVTIAATVPPEFKAALEDMRWTNRQSMSELITLILKDYLAKNGVAVDLPQE